MKAEAKPTLAQVLMMVFAGLMLLTPWLVVTFSKPDDQYRRSKERCAANLRGLHQALYSYGLQYRGRFPMAGEFDPHNNSPVRGFDSTLPRHVVGPDFDPKDLKNNATASLWLLVKNRSMKVNGYVCPGTNDEGDYLTIDGSANGKPVSLEGTADFFARKNLSFSIINMYHVEAGRRWAVNGAPGWVLMGDNNDADEAPRLHQLSRGSSPPSNQEIHDNENSTNHIREGQNFMFADGSVSFKTDPFVGPSNDNVYADDLAEKAGEPEQASPPTLSTSRRGANAHRNVVLLPLSGNKGVNLDPDKSDNQN